MVMAMEEKAATVTTALAAAVAAAATAGSLQVLADRCRGRGSLVD